MRSTNKRLRTVQYEAKQQLAPRSAAAPPLVVVAVVVPLLCFFPAATTHQQYSFPLVSIHFSSRSPFSGTLGAGSFITVAATLMLSRAPAKIQEKNN